MWYFVGVVLVLIYLAMFPLMWNEWNKQSPYWNASRYWHLLKTYWAWPALFVYVMVLASWELYRARHKD